MKKSFCLISLFLLAMVCGAEAQDEHLKLHFDFSQTDGTYVTDAASGIYATQPGDFTALKALVEECQAFVTSAGGDSPSTFAPTNTHTTWPTPTVVRGGTGQNYMNCARGAAMAAREQGAGRERGESP